MHGHYHSLVVIVNTADKLGRIGLDVPELEEVLADERDPVVRPCGHLRAGAADRRGGHGDHGDRRVPVSAVVRREDDLRAGRVVLSREDRDG